MEEQDEMWFDSKDAFTRVDAFDIIYFGYMVFLSIYLAAFAFYHWYNTEQLRNEEFEYIVQAQTLDIEMDEQRQSLSFSRRNAPQTHVNQGSSTKQKAAKVTSGDGMQTVQSSVHEKKELINKNEIEKPIVLKLKDKTQCTESGKKYPKPLCGNKVQLLDDMEAAVLEDMEDATDDDKPNLLEKKNASGSIKENRTQSTKAEIEEEKNK